MPRRASVEPVYFEPGGFLDDDLMADDRQRPGAEPQRAEGHDRSSLRALISTGCDTRSRTWSRFWTHAISVACKARYRWASVMLPQANRADVPGLKPCCARC